MPLVDFDLQETWESLYSVEVEGVPFHFHRSGRERLLGHDAWYLRQSLDFKKTDRILIVGAAFGWVAEEWAIAGYNVTACDTSKWIHANKKTHALLDIVDADVLTEKGRKILGNFDWCITEDVLPALSDVEAVQLAAACRLLAPQVVHWVTVKLSEDSTADPRLNWKSLGDWQQLMAPDRVIQRQL